MYLFEVYTSTSHTKNIDGTIYEGIGLTPDIEALYNEEAFMQGNDTQLERAIQYIQTGKWSFLSVASINRITKYILQSTTGGTIVSPAKFSTVININKLNNQQMKKTSLLYTAAFFTESCMNEIRFSNKS